MFSTFQCGSVPLRWRHPNMLYYLTAAGLLAHTCFWGAGLAGLALPREWRRWWWVFAPGFGLALQSAVVWAGAHTTLAGTAVYARWSEVIPLTLLLTLSLRRERRYWWLARIFLTHNELAARSALRSGDVADDTRTATRTSPLHEISGPTGLRLPVVAGWLAVLLAAGWMLIQPMAQPGPGLTASSLGSCDHADYAAGARVFQEFSKNDRTGFLGLSEVTHVRSAEYFFDFWLRLNHFTPSALLAHNAAVFGVEAYRLISVTAASLVLLNLPMVLFLGRITLGIRGGWLVGLVVLYAVSPLNAYAVHHGALGQLYAVQGIGILTVAIFGASRATHHERSAWPYFALLLAGLWLLAGSYNFILLVCLAPAGAWLAALLWYQRKWRAVGQVLFVLVAALGACVLFFWGRFDGLIERFSLFEQYNFGWAVPLFTPEGWLGILRDLRLNAWPNVARVLLSAMVAGLWLAGLRALWRRRNMQVFAALSLVLPVIFGWGVLAWESRVRANASYDAFKIFSVFYPGLLIGLCSWVAAARGARPAVVRLAGISLGLLVAANFLVSLDFRRQMANPPLRVGRDLVDLGRLEQEPRVASLNMLIEDYWARLWANAFLLRKPQYFLTHTYEGRLDTPLRGEWNLSDSPLHCFPLRSEDRIAINARFHAERVAGQGTIFGIFAQGWYAEERSSGIRWRWSNGQGALTLTNPSNDPVRASLRMRVRALSPRLLEIRLGDVLIAAPQLDGSEQEIVVGYLRLLPGRNDLNLSTAATVSPGKTDARQLGVALYDFELRALSLVQ